VPARLSHHLLPFQAKVEEGVEVIKHAMFLVFTFKYF